MVLQFFSVVYNVIIIGSGPAGLTAAIYAARANLEPLVIAGATPGGQLMVTSDVENYPGFPNGIQGPELMQLFREQALRFGTTLINADIVSADLRRYPFSLSTSDTTYQCKSVIIATGATAKWIGLDSETRLRGKGVSACATCDGFFFRGKRVAVVGGGDAALEEANFLTKFATSVTVIHRRDALRASKIMQDRAKANPKISFIWNSEVIEVLGDTHVTGLKLKNVRTDERMNVQTDGLFVAIGHEPNTSIFKGQLDLDVKGYMVVHDHTRTSVDGVFTAGDVHDHHYRQAITAAGFGCMAAIDVERWLEEKGVATA
ncbi:thioredoxin-disulfide reductase [Candidatus Uhrbacteria bacterium]|nr:thioredoxin-disulfide reductase [Candidatus Uhrbacteria bacterium]